MRVERERVDLLYRQNKQGLVALIIYGSSYLFFSWPHRDHTYLVVWALLLYGSGLVRVALTVRWNKVRNELDTIERVRPWLRTIHALLLLSGCLWGSISFLIPTATTVSQQIVSAVVVIMMAAGAVACYSASLGAVVRVLVPAMLPWAVASLLSPVPTFNFIGVMLLLYIVLAIKTARTSGQFVMNSLRLGFENTRLAENLREEERESREHEAANKAKSTLLANVSHEIRTPLAAINGFTEMVLQNPVLPQALHGDVRMILRNGKYLVSLVSDLLDLSKAENGQLYIQKDSISIAD
ncbi:MAG: histidine kinase dimerization/phospho-acceptor domain-containing protein, partial [Bdellovibrionota bacterium]